MADGQHGAETEHATAWSTPSEDVIACLFKTPDVPENFKNALLGVSAQWRKACSPNVKSMIIKIRAEAHPMLHTLEKKIFRVFENLTSLEIHEANGSQSSNDDVDIPVVTPDPTPEVDKFMQNLTQLTFKSYQFSPKDNLQFLEKMRSLSSLHLYYPKLAKSALESLSSLPSLTELSLSGTRFHHGTDFEQSIKDECFDDVCVEALYGLTKLKSLDLGFTLVSDLGMAELSRYLGNLTRLGLRGAKEVFRSPTQPQGSHWLEGFPGLVALDLQETHVGDNFLLLLAKLTNLEELNLGVTHVTTVDQLGSLPRLQTLHLADCPLLKSQDSVCSQLSKFANLQMMTVKDGEEERLQKLDLPFNIEGVQSVGALSSFSSGQVDSMIDDELDRAYSSYT